jgi:hypothetical protein
MDQTPSSRQLCVRILIASAVRLPSRTIRFSQLMFAHTSPIGDRAILVPMYSVLPERNCPQH